jgi:hypothetical protein
MRTETITYYTFTELSPEAQTRALSNLDSRWTFDADEYDIARADALEAFLRALGSDAEDVDLEGHLGLTFAQGAGFSVTGRVVWNGTEYDVAPDYASGLRSHYVHENTVTVNYAGDDEHSQYDEVPGEVVEAFRSAMRKGYRAAEDYYWSVTSDDSLRERLAEDGDLEGLEFFESGAVAVPRMY